MSQAVLNNSQATGHTDLLSGILKVQVRNEEKITEQDRIYCQNQQDELYKTLDQIAWWYNIFKREAEKYEGKIKLKHEPNGKITTSSYDLHYRYNNDEKDYTHHELLLSRTSMSWWIVVITLSGTSSVASSAISTTPTASLLKHQRLMRRLFR